MSPASAALPASSASGNNNHFNSNSTVTNNSTVSVNGDGSRVTVTGLPTRPGAVDSMFLRSNNSKRRQLIARARNYIAQVTVKPQAQRGLEDLELADALKTFIAQIQTEAAQAQAAQTKLEAAFNDK